MQLIVSLIRGRKVPGNLIELFLLIRMYEIDVKVKREWKNYSLA
jgi:hypothetical protein